MSKKQRKAVVESLRLITTENGKRLGVKSCQSYETDIYEMCKRISKEIQQPLNDVYREQAYQKVGELVKCQTKDQRTFIIDGIHNDRVGFESNIYEEYAKRQSIEMSSSASGPKVAEGEFPCRNPKCRNKRCYYYQLQTRSGDEGFTCFVLCPKCGTRFKFG